MTKFRAGGIVSLEFPFSDLHTHKRRPELVLVGGDVDVLVARVTTRPPRAPSDVALNHWGEIGLPRASTVRLTKLATVDQRLVHHNIGRLYSQDSRAVAQAWRQLTVTVVKELRE